MANYSPTSSPEKPRLNRDQIIEASFNLINKEGIDRFSIRALAQKLNSSPMALYTYFPSKEALLDAVYARLRSEYDNSPVPGERWDDTLRRTTASIRRVDLKYPNVYRAASGWMPESQVHTRRISHLHKDQGIPLEIYEPLWCAIEAFLVGFVHQEIVQNATIFEPISTDDPDYEWLTMAENAYSDESFARGIELIIEGVRNAAAPDPCEWYTPLDPSEWTWRP